MRNGQAKLTEENKVEDLHVYNDSNFLMLHSQPADKKALPIKDQKDAVKRELAIVLPVAKMTLTFFVFASVVHLRPKNVNGLDLPRDT